MRKVIVSNIVSVDGFIAGPQGEINWFAWNEETADYCKEMLASVGIILFGRVTYELMAGYWPTEMAVKGDAVVARFMNGKPKLAFSRTLKKADWANTRLVKEDPAKVVAALKQQPGKDLMIFGSANLAATLIKHGLIDEYQVMINPLVLGRGRPLFQGVRDRLHLQLVSTRVFRVGNVLLTYKPKPETQPAH